MVVERTTANSGCNGARLLSRERCFSARSGNRFKLGNPSAVLLVAASAGTWGQNARKPNRHLGFDKLSTLGYHRWIESVKLSLKTQNACLSLGVRVQKNSASWRIGITMTFAVLRPILSAPHQTGTHPERPERLGKSCGIWNAPGPTNDVLVPVWQPASLEQLHASPRSHPYPGGVASILASRAEDAGKRIPSVAKIRSLSQSFAAGAVCDAVGNESYAVTRAPSAVSGAATGTPRPARPQRHGLLPIRQCRPGGKFGHFGFGSKSSADRRLGCAPRQWHASHLLGRSSGRFSVDSSVALLSGHWWQPMRSAAASTPGTKVNSTS